MAGHNKWSKIKRKKGKEDAKRSKIFSRLIKEITVAVKEGGGSDPEFNPRLRLAIANAKGENMPKDNIKRAIKKAADPKTGNMFQPTYEGYGPNGVAVFVECTTDNINRTVASIRSTFTQKGGSLGTSGSVDYQFERKGLFVIPMDGHDIQDLELELIDGGAEEIEEEKEENQLTVTVAFEDFGNMQSKLEELGIEPKSANLERFPLNEIALELSEAKAVLDLVDELEDDEDVQKVFHNLEMTEEVESYLNEA